MKFRNESGLKFIDISSEAFRIYEWADSAIKIERPLWLHVSESGGHRIFDEAGFSHYIPPGWLHLQWKARDGQPHFVK